MKKNLIYQGTLYFWELSQFGICFLLSNSLLIIFFLPFRFILIPFYIIAFLLVVPAFEALCIAQIKSQTPIFSLYFKSYQEVFTEGFLLGSGYGFLFIILTVDLYLFTAIYPQEGLRAIFTLLLVILGLHFSFTILIRAKLLINMKDTFKLSSYLIFKYPVVSLKFIGLFTLTYLSFILVPQFSIIIAIPLLSQLLLKLSEKLFLDLFRQFS